MTTFLILCYGRSYIYCYYVIDVLTYLAAFFTETPVFVDCKVTKCVEKKKSCVFAFLMIEDVQVVEKHCEM